MPAAVEARKERGRAIAELFRIEKRSGKWSVPSSRGRSRYSVDLDADRPTCTCEDFASQGEPCKHVYAAMEVAEGRVGKIDAKAVSASDRLRDGDVVLAKTAAPRPTYRQDWPAYNFAQAREKGHFRELMADLCRGITEQPRKPGAGRKPAMMRDLAFAAAFKVYSTVSGRRLQPRATAPPRSRASSETSTSSRSPFARRNWRAIALRRASEARSVIIGAPWGTRRGLYGF